MVVETLERVRCVVTRAIPAIMIMDGRVNPADVQKPKEERLDEFDADVLIATDGAFVLEVPRTDARIFPCSRWDWLNFENGDRLRVIGMALITHGAHRWQIIAERPEV